MGRQLACTLYQRNFSGKSNKSDNCYKIYTIIVNS